MLRLDDLLSDEERQIQSVVRKLMDQRVRPFVAGWYEDGSTPVRELALEFGKLGLLGMHLSGYGCAGLESLSPTARPAWSSRRPTPGVRSLVSVQGSLAMYAIWRFGSEEQKQHWLPRMATAR
jgi:glutaryl-CoA dehydrogenase